MASIAPDHKHQQANEQHPSWHHITTLHCHVMSRYHEEASELTSTLCQSCHGQQWTEVPLQGKRPQGHRAGAPGPNSPSMGYHGGPAPPGSDGATDVMPATPRHHHIIILYIPWVEGMSRSEVVVSLEAYMASMQSSNTTLTPSLLHWVCGTPSLLHWVCGTEKRHRSSTSCR